MGNGATRSLERVAAAMGELESAPIEFQATCDVVTRGAANAHLILDKLTFAATPVVSGVLPACQPC